MTISVWLRFAAAVIVVHLQESCALSLHSGPILKNEEIFDDFGQPRYNHQWPASTWEDLAGDSALGTECDAEEEDHPCGDTLVCRKGMCRHCLTDRECPSWHHCIQQSGKGFCLPIQRKAWQEVYYDRWERLCTILVFLASILSAAAGVGGGGMFVPLLMLFSGMRTEAAIPLSQVMVLGSSTVNLMLFTGQLHPIEQKSAKIDYDCAVLAEPMLCLGVSLGVLAHAMAPDWFMLSLLGMTLGVALWRTLKKGLQQWHEESKLLANDEQGEGAKPQEESVTSAWRTHWTNVSYLTHINARQIMGLACIWTSWLAVSSSRLPVCSAEFLLLMLACAVATVLCTFATSKWIPQQPGAPMKWAANPRDDRSLLDIMRFPLVAFGAGWLGGLLGIGGGMIMSPVLLEMGMHSEAVQATSAMFVFLSSSLATVQYAVMSKHVWHYSLWYGCVTIAATLLGQQICAVFVQKHKRYSVITLSIAAVMVCSLAAISFMGVQDLMEGGRWTFSLTRLCHASSPSIITKDVAAGVRIHA
mmetsp:Transcript_44053/g.104235  ORF Transcript_44053/g.104235 Transcript_44053/m.104235 type:complete len:529 (+) Transcript_44053:126-1712(+)